MILITLVNGEIRRADGTLDEFNLKVTNVASGVYRFIELHFVDGPRLVNVDHVMEVSEQP